jgi:polyphosphate kinase 2 (PPK2 family)
MGSDKTSRAVEIEVDGKLRTFDIDDPNLPDWVEDGMLSHRTTTPMRRKLDRKKYEKTLEELQIELVKVQTWLARHRKPDHGGVRRSGRSRQGRIYQRHAGLHEP